MTTRKETAATNETTSYTKPPAAPAPTPGVADAPRSRCTETWDEALEVGYFGEAYEDGDLVFPGPEPETPEEPAPEPPPEESGGETPATSKRTKG